MSVQNVDMYSRMMQRCQQLAFSYRTLVVMVMNSVSYSGWQQEANTRRSLPELAEKHSQHHKQAEKGKIAVVLSIKLTMYTHLVCLILTAARKCQLLLVVEPFSDLFPFFVVFNPMHYSGASLINVYSSESVIKHSEGIGMHCKEELDMVKHNKKHGKPG